MVAVRVTKDEVIITDPKRVPVEYMTIVGKEDGRSYKVHKEGTGKTKHVELKRFPKPGYGEDVSEDVLKDFNFDEQEYILKRILIAQARSTQNTVEILTKQMNAIIPGISLVDIEWEGVTEFIDALDEMKKEMKKAKWKKNSKTSKQ